jgi:hypothetical protein
MIIEIWKNIKGKRYFLKLKFLSVSTNKEVYAK